jgi:chromosome segregation ATPase
VTEINEAQKTTEQREQGMDAAELAWQDLEQERRNLDKDYVLATGEGDLRRMETINERRRALELEIPAAEVRYRKARIAYLEAQRSEIGALRRDTRPRIDEVRAQIKALEKELAQLQREASNRSGSGAMQHINLSIAREKERLDAAVARHASSQNAPVMRFRPKVRV